jgi:hypothetical protein
LRSSKITSKLQDIFSFFDVMEVQFPGFSHFGQKPALADRSWIWNCIELRLSERDYRSLSKLEKFVFLNRQRVRLDRLGAEFYRENP